MVDESVVIDPNLLEVAASILEALNDNAVQQMYASCPYLLRDGSEGAYGPNTCIGGCREEPECVTGGEFEPLPEETVVALELCSWVDNEVKALRDENDKLKAKAEALIKACQFNLNTRDYRSVELQVDDLKRLV